MVVANVIILMLILYERYKQAEILIKYQGEEMASAFSSLCKCAYLIPPVLSKV